MKEQEKKVVVDNLIRLYRISLKGKLSKESKEEFDLYKNIVKKNFPKEVNEEIAKIIGS